MKTVSDIGIITSFFLDPYLALCYSQIWPLCTGDFSKLQVSPFIQNILSTHHFSCIGLGVIEMRISGKFRIWCIYCYCLD